MASASPRKPGLLLVHPRLHTPDAENAATFLRWTKLHFRDMLNIPDTSLGKVTRDLRFVASDASPKYTHDVKEGELPKYLYTCLVDDIALLKSSPYYSVSRKLNLETTRALESGEEAVAGEKEMVFDIVDAQFAVYEKLHLDIGLPTFQDLPTRFTSRNGVPLNKSSLVVLNFEDAGDEMAAEGKTVKMLKHLYNLQNREPPCLQTFHSVYRWSGEGAQPEGHPLIEGGRGERMVLFLVVDVVRDVRPRGHLVKEIKGWVGEENGKGEGVEVGFGVWNGEVFMS